MTSPKFVSFNEGKNETREYTRVEEQDKPNVWMSKKQIRENRLMAQEERMMETTRELVKAKLVEETPLDKSDPQALVQQVKALQAKLDEILSGPKENILAFLQTKYNWITDSNDYWKDLPPDVQDSAQTLGYTQEMWDRFEQPLDAFSKRWNVLTKEQQSAASHLGYNEFTWNGSLEGDLPPEGSTPQPELKPDQDSGAATSVDPDQSQSTMTQDEPMYNWDPPSDASSSSSSEERTPILYDSEDEPMDTGVVGAEYNWGSTNKIESDSDESEQGVPDDSSSSDREDNMFGRPSIYPPKESQAVPVSDDDEEEFISNFLSDFSSNTASEPGTKPPTPGSTLQSRYIPSDDELEWKEDEIDETAATNQDSARPSLYYGAVEEEDHKTAESSPLLGRSKAIATASGGLFRRATAPDSRSREIPFATDGQSGDALRDENTKQTVPRSALALHPALWVLLLGFLLAWVIFHSM